MSAMQPKNEVIAILCSDLHLSHTAPLARQDEPDWYGAMMKPLIELKILSHQNNCPIIMAGDLFHKWNSPPELINFALQWLPDNMYCIPGQHDLPLHNLEDIEKSAFFTLMKAGKIRNIASGQILAIELSIMLHGYTWGDPLQKKGKIHEKDHNWFHLAVVHEFIWMKDHGYPGAPEENKIGMQREKLEGYDAAVFGDNHKGFKTKIGKTTVFNCGGFMRRHSDQVDYKPQVGLLHRDGTIKIHYLNTEKEKIIVTTEPRKSNNDNGKGLKEFLQGLNKLEDSALDFEEAMKRRLKKHKEIPDVEGIIYQAMESK